MHCREQRREEREVGEGLEAPEDGVDTARRKGNELERERKEIKQTNLKMIAFVLGSLRKVWWSMRKM
jgi:hypothetical protein